jgi:hypothetical protein
MIYCKYGFKSLQINQKHVDTLAGILCPGSECQIRSKLAWNSAILFYRKVRQEIA